MVFKLTIRTMRPFCLHDVTRESFAAQIVCFSDIFFYDTHVAVLCSCAIPKFGKKLAILCLKKSSVGKRIF